MIDLHAHYVSPSVIEEVKRAGSSLGPIYRETDGSFELPSGPTRRLPPPLLDLKARDEWIASEGISLQVLSPWLDLMPDDLGSEHSRAWVGVLNDCVAADIEDRSAYRAFAALPLSSGEDAASELERCVNSLGFVGATLPTQIRGRDLDVAGLEPLFEAATELDVPLFVHPGPVMAADRMRDRFLWNVCGNPFETTLAAVRLFLAGSFDRWPRLRLLLAHCGGALPFLAGRVWQAAASSPEIDKGVAVPVEVLEPFFYDCVVHDVDALAFAIRRVGVKRICLGTDAPFPMRLTGASAHVHEACKRAGLVGCDEEICEGSPLRLLGRDPAGASAGLAHAPTSDMENST
ncbi:MAG: amidohydrolase family protein [Actinomycetota bacterium]